MKNGLSGVGIIFGLAAIGCWLGAIWMTAYNMQLFFTGLLFLGAIFLTE